MKIALIDLDAMLHIICYVQYGSGNDGNEQAVIDHVKRFMSNVEKNCKCTHALPFYQDAGHTNFRNELLPEYKEDRVTKDAVKIWKPVIIDTFKELGAYRLQHLESDDAISALAQHIGYDSTVIVENDKDMLQVPGLHYNPFKRGLSNEDRWYNINMQEAGKFFWQQVLTGDSIDISADFCGIPGVGPVRAIKILDKDKVSYRKAVHSAYTHKFGAKEGFKRAKLTYKMVRLLKTNNNPYISDAAKNELDLVLSNYEKSMYEIKDELEQLFDNSSSTGIDDLFN